MLRFAQLFVSTSAVALLACGSDAPTEPAALAESKLESAKPATFPRPAGGSCSTQFEFLAPDVVLIQLDCNLLHLGRTSGVSTQTITVTGPTPTGELSTVLSSSPAYTAANGDVLYASFSGTGIISPASGTVSFTGTETFSGGTGRFAAATGSVALSGSASLASSTGSYETAGSIVY